MEKSALFINKLVEDQEFQAALAVAAQAAVTKEEKIAATTKFANEAGFDVSPGELQKYVESIQNSSNLLSDDDLENVAGGADGQISQEGLVVGQVVGYGVGTAVAGPAGGVVGGTVGGAVGAIYGDDIADATGSAAGSVSEVTKQVFSSW